MPIGVTVAQGVGRCGGHPNWHHFAIKLPDQMYPSGGMSKCADEIQTPICLHGAPRREQGIRCDGRQVLDDGLNTMSYVLMALETIMPTLAPFLCRKPMDIGSTTSTGR